MINALHLFFAFKSYNDARSCPSTRFQWPIQTVFGYEDENRVPVRVCTGVEDPDCARDVCESQTSMPASYVFVEQDRRYCIIDTPGVGDTNGIDADKMNCQSVIDYLSTFNKLDSIVVLVRSTSCRVTPHFVYFIGEFLSNLHKDASKNICFCFTCSRCTGFRAGDAYAAIKKVVEPIEGLEIDSSNSFFVDCEFVRSIAITQSGILLSKFDEAVAENSWDRFSKELRRLLSRAVEQRPYDVKSMISIAKARRLIVELDRPLTDISETIRINLELIESTNRDIKFIQRHGLCSDDAFVRNLLRSRIVIRAFPIRMPVRVCYEACCIRDYTEFNVEKRGYLCEGGRKSLWTRKGETPRCRKCKCEWSSHGKLYYRIERSLEFEPPAVPIGPPSQQIVLDQAFCELLVKHGELCNEQTAVANASNAFARFVVRNAIVPINRAVLGYLDMCIEKMYMKRKSCNKSAADELRRRHAAPLGVISAAVGKYIDGAGARANRENPETRDDADDGGCGDDADSAVDDVDEIVMSPDEVEELIIRLYKLKHYGKELRRLVEIKGSS